MCRFYTSFVFAHRSHQIAGFRVLRAAPFSPHAPAPEGQRIAVRGQGGFKPTFETIGKINQLAWVVATDGRRKVRCT